jgi:heptosyltransferase II
MGTLPARVLIDLPNWLGDLIHTLPALQALKEANRRGETWAVAPAAYGPLVEMLGVQVIPRPEGAGWSWARRELGDRFEVAVTARHSTRAKLMLAGCRARVRLASQGRGAEALGLDAFPVDRSRHQRHDLGAALLRLGIRPPRVAPARLHVPPALAQLGLLQRGLLARRDRPTVALLPGARGLAAKRYPAEGYRELARALVRHDCAPLVIVGPGEEALGLWVASATSSAVVPTAWKLDEVAGMLAACDAAVGHDSGLTHLASVTGPLTLALFGPTDPGRTGPVGAAGVLQAPVLHGSNAPDWSALSPDHVANVLTSGLAATRGLRVSAVGAIIPGCGGPLAQLVEQGTLNP